MDPDLARPFLEGDLGPLGRDLGPNSLKSISAGDTNWQRVVFSKEPRKVYKVVISAQQAHNLKIDWLLSLKQFFINVSYHILVASLTLMALFCQSLKQFFINVSYHILVLTEPSELD